jgi:hydrogenase expression/formation protein HypE
LQGKDGSLPIGKLPPLLLHNIIALTRVSPDPTVVQGPKLGEDAGVISLPCCDLVVHSDPITEASENVGWLAVNVAANDVAVSGACPRWASITLLLPEEASRELAHKIAGQIGRATMDLGLDIIGGHTEVAPKISRSIVVATVIGLAPPGHSIRTGNVKPGDHIVMVGYAGLEGSSILATDFKDLLVKCGVPESLVSEASELAGKISVVKPACMLSGKRLVHSMHDATEGGVIGALTELALASGLTIRVEAGKIPIHPTTRIISACLGIDPLKLISSGVLLAAIPSDKSREAAETLISMGFRAEIIGEASRGPPRLLLHRDSIIEEYKIPPRDEIYKVWE